MATEQGPAGLFFGSGPKYAETRRLLPFMGSGFLFDFDVPPDVADSHGENRKPWVGEILARETCPLNVEGPFSSLTGLPQPKRPDKLWKMMRPSGVDIILNDFKRLLL